MYPVSDEYLTALSTNSRAQRLSGTVNGIAFNGKDVIRNSFSIRNQICDATKISLGGVYIGQLELTFSAEFALRMNLRGSWKGKLITASIGIELEDGSFESVPINGGTYTIDSAQWVDEGIKIVAYDNMVKFDKALGASITNGKAYDYLVFACKQCGVELGMSDAQINQLINSEYLVYPSVNNALETYRDLISNIAVMCACFATINRESKLVLIPLPSYEDSVLVIPASLRFSTSFADFASYYSTLELTNPSDGSISQYFNENIGGLTMDIGENPFLEVGLPETYTAMRQNIINKIQSFRATPFSASILPNPALDLGDQIVFAGGIGQDSLGCVMSFTHKLDWTVIEGYGESPASSAAVTNLAKRVSAQARSTKDELISHLFTNAQELELGDEQSVDVINISFATVSKRVVKMLHEIKLDLDITSETGIATCTAYYYLNDELIAYQPITSWNNDGYHLLHLIYATQDLLPGTAYKWTVRLTISGGTATIDRGDILAILEGQGLAALDEFDGLIELDDTYVPISGTAIKALVDSLEIEFIRPTNISGEDTYTPVSTGTVVQLTDSADIKFSAPIYTRITEDGFERITEDDFGRITE